MILGVPKERMEEENRVAALPETVRRYAEMGFRVLVESKAGEGVFHYDSEYASAGAEIVPDAETLYRRSDVVIKVKQPCLDPKTGKHEVEMLREGSTLIAFLHPAAPMNHALVRRLAERNITSFTMDGIPRISRAQPMDALTSMSTVTGYKAVIMAAGALPRFVPLMGTAVGTIQPARVLVVGTGVAGLQAIATARRLGAVVTAVDIRPEARREAGSLKGTRIAGFEAPEDIAMGPDGYARALPEDWLRKERELLAGLLRETDIAILSALVPGEVAPVLVTEDMLGNMRPGSVIVDISIDQGGNCSATQPGRETVCRGVKIFGMVNIPGSMAVDATWLYSTNLLRYVENLFKRGLSAPDFDDEIVRASLVTRDGKIRHHGALKAMGLLEKEAVR